MLSRAQHGAEQLLAAAGLAEDDLRRVADSIVEAATTATEASRASGPARSAAVLAAPQVGDSPPVPAPSLAEPPVSPPSATEAEREAGGQGEPDEKPT